MGRYGTREDEEVRLLHRYLGQQILGMFA